MKQAMVTLQISVRQIKIVLWVFENINNERDKDTYADSLVGISDKRMKMLGPFRLSAFLLSSSNPSYSFPWQAVCRVSPLSVATSHPLSENVQHTLSRHGYSAVSSRSCWNRIQ